MTPKPRRQQGTGTVFQRKDGRWVGRIDVGFTPTGGRKYKEVSAKTEAEAKAKLRAAQNHIIKHGRTTTSTRATIKTWADTWLETTSDTVRPKTWATNRSGIRQWLVPTIGKVRLTDLTPAHLRSVTTAIERAGRAASTAQRVHVMTIKMLRDAILEGHDVPQRVLLTEAPRPGANDRGAIDMPDALALLQAAADRPDGSRWVAALLQGMRQGECLGLTWDAVDLERGLVDVSWQLQALPYLNRAEGTFRVPRDYEKRHLWKAFHLVRPKSAHGFRMIPLVPWMVAALTDWKEKAPASPYGLVWSRADGLPIAAKTDTAAWVALQDAARVAKVNDTVGRRYELHEARHTTATLLMEGGTSDVVTTAILGHSSIITSRGYQHAADRMTRQAMEQIAGRYGLLLDPPTQGALLQQPDPQ